MKCNSCEIMYVNGYRCHEHGCPDAWKDYKRPCKWCGSEFMPENKHQDFCCDSCYFVYNDMPGPDEIAEYNDYHSTI